MDVRVPRAQDARERPLAHRSTPKIQIQGKIETVRQDALYDRILARNANKMTSERLAELRWALRPYHPCSGQGEI